MNRHFIYLVVVVCILSGCQSNGAGKGMHVGCDTVFYSFKKNALTERYIDSLLQGHTVDVCSFKYTDYFDTVEVRFSLIDSGAAFATPIPSNRFLLLKERRMKVLSDEDYFLPLKRTPDNVNRDPNYISVALTIPDLDVVGVVRYPPF